MSTVKRKSLKERNSESIALGGQTAPAPAPVEDSTPETSPAMDAPVTTRPHVTKAAPHAERPKARLEERSARPGIYFHEEEFMAAKSAFLADWRAGGTADKFPTWIAAALDSHAARSPQERTQLGKRNVRANSRGFTRSFEIPSDVVERMKAAIVEDNDDDQWPTISGWAGAAIAAAVEVAKTRAGGALPPAPPRLPNRLTR